MILRPFWTVPMGNIGQGAAAKRRSLGGALNLRQIQKDHVILCFYKKAVNQHKVEVYYFITYRIHEIIILKLQ